MKKYLSIISMALVLSACAQPTVPIVDYKNILVTLPKSYMGHCKVVAPPDRESFVEASKDDRVTMLIGMNAALMNSIKDCNDRWDVADTWQEKALTQYANSKNTSFVGQSPDAPVTK